MNAIIGRTTAVFVLVLVAPLHARAPALEADLEGFLEDLDGLDRLLRDILEQMEVETGGKEPGARSFSRELRGE